jgi:hypothetical protein
MKKKVVVQCDVKKGGRDQEFAPALPYVVEHLQK